MKSREGTVVDADDLMDEMVGTATEISKELGKLDGMTQEEINAICTTIGLGSLKYFILKVDPRKNMTFNPKESIDFNGNTGSFIQYAHARIQSVLRKATELNLSENFDEVQLNDKEIALISALASFPEVVKQAGKEYSPSLIANYTYDLVKEYNQFYHDYSILKEEDAAVRAMRIVLSRNVAKVIKQAMALLGIGVPDKM
jgi:arginyl-tRNA synthetase